MDRLVVFMAMGGLINFALGAFLSATGEAPLGIAFMAAGLALQVFSLARIRKLKNKGQSYKGQSDKGQSDKEQTNAGR